MDTQKKMDCVISIWLIMQYIQADLGYDVALLYYIHCSISLAAVSVIYFLFCTAFCIFHTSSFKLYTIVMVDSFD